MTVEFCNKRALTEAFFVRGTIGTAFLEAVWKQLGIELAERHLTVTQLDAHSPDRHSVNFKEGQKSSAAK